MAIVTRERRVYNPGSCPLPVNVTPDPQFVASTAQCQQADPRANSNRVAKKRDQNPNSPSYLQWLKQDNTYSANQAEGGLYLYDQDPVACPLPVTKYVSYYGIVVNQPQFLGSLTVERNNADPVAITVNFNLFYSSPKQLHASYSLTINAGEYSISEPIYGMKENKTYTIEDVVISDPAYTASGNGIIVGTPFSNTPGPGGEEGS